LIRETGHRRMSLPVMRPDGEKNMFLAVTGAKKQTGTSLFP